MILGFLGSPHEVTRRSSVVAEPVGLCHDACSCQAKPKAERRFRGLSIFWSALAIRRTLRNEQALGLLEPAARAVQR
jgi:hypothetical protein